MPDTFKKVQRGDPLVIPAATFNTFIDAARDFQQRQRSARRRAQRERQDAGIILVRNESGQDRERFDVLGIQGRIITPTDNADEFTNRVALSGDVPSTTHAGRFVVLLEPLRDGAIGRVCIDGVCVVRVEMVDEGHGFADVKAGDASELESAAAGTAQLLWVQPEEDRDDPAIAWTVARLGVLRHLLHSSLGMGLQGRAHASQGPVPRGLLAVAARSPAAPLPTSGSPCSSSTRPTR